MTELEHKVATKQYLRSRISDIEVERLIALLRISGESLLPLTGSAPALVRDPKDNYLLVATAISGADILVTGDNDLLVLREHLRKPSIMTATEFLELITSSSPPQP